MDIFEIIEEAKKSEFGGTWFSEKGPIFISKEGRLKPIKLGDLPKYQPERSKREDLCFCVYCEKDKSKEEITGFICKECMET